MTSTKSQNSAVTVNVQRSGHYSR